MVAVIKVDLVALTERERYHLRFNVVVLFFCFCSPVLYIHHCSSFPKPNTENRVGGRVRYVW